MLIDRNSEIFQNNDFIKDKYLFNVYFDMFQSNEQIFYSDEKNYIIGRGNIGYPIWIWTKENITNDVLQEIKETLDNYYLTKGTNEITCKKELYDYLKENINIKEYHEIAFLSCKKTSPVDITSGYIDKPNYGDKTLLARYWIDNCEEIYKGRKMTFQESLEEVSDWLENNNFYVWRNPLGKAVSIASIDKIDQAGRISHVYTPKEERKNGYCKSLIYTLTNKLLENNKIPILYTDHDYKISNHMYKKIGYQEESVLANIKFQK